MSAHGSHGSHGNWQNMCKTNNKVMPRKSCVKCCVCVYLRVFAACALLVRRKFSNQIFCLTNREIERDRERISQNCCLLLCELWSCYMMGSAWDCWPIVSAMERWVLQNIWMWHMDDKCFVFVYYFFLLPRCTCPCSRLKITRRK